MNHHIPCEIVRDLMPLVIDSAVSGESRKWVEAHVAECAQCKRLMDDMRADISTAQAREKDADFVRFCLKMRKALSWRRLLKRALIFLLVAALTGSGAAYAHYKMYVDWVAVKPAEYSVGVDQDGLLVFEFLAPRMRGPRGYGISYDKGICYFTPHVSAWPQYFGRPGERNTYDFISDIRMKDGALVYAMPDGEELVFNEMTGRYTARWKVAYSVIQELRIGTKEEYETAYRSGDELPVVPLDKGVDETASGRIGVFAASPLLLVPEGQP